MHFATCILFFLFVIYSSLGDEEEKTYKCELGAFLEEDKSGVKAILVDHGIVSSKLPGCEDRYQKECSETVAVEVRKGTNNGNFSLTVDDNDEYTVGDILCDKADTVEENVRMKTVRIYYRACGGVWTKTGYSMPEKLCCEDGLYVPCTVYLKT